MRIFLDIGGYRGHSVLAALDPLFSFDRVISFEPVPDLAATIRRIGDPRLLVLEAALSDFEGSAILYHAGTLAGSLAADAPEYLEQGSKVEVRVLDAATLLPSITTPTDFIRAKFNCEGAEVDIIARLLEKISPQHTDAILQAALVDFDADKIPSKAHRTAQIQASLAERGISYLTPPQCQYGMVTNYGGVRNYLIVSGAKTRGLLPLIKSVIYNVALMRNKDVNGYHKMRLLKALPILRTFARSATLRVTNERPHETV